MVNLVLFDDKLSKILKYEISAINSHLPTKRVSLSAAIDGKREYVRRDNSKVSIDQKEIELLNSLCPPSKRKSVLLPIIIVRRRNLGAGAYVITGELVAQYLVLKALGKIEDDWINFMDSYKGKLSILYKPELSELRKKLPTCTVLGFS